MAELNWTIDGRRFRNQEEYMAAKRDKQLIDSGEYTSMSVPSASARYITKDSDGNTLAFWDWEDSDWMFGFDTDITNGIEFEAASISDPENYACMFCKRQHQFH